MSSANDTLLLSELADVPNSQCHEFVVSLVSTIDFNALIIKQMLPQTLLENF